MMKTCRFLFLLGTLLGLCGCSGPECFGGATAVSPGPQPGVVLVGEQARLEIAPTVLNTCSDEGNSNPESLTVEVSGPDNLPVASQGTLGNPTSAIATVKFTPDKLGRYHVFAAFDPIGGIQQLDVYAARNRSAEASVFTLPTPCTSLERTQRGGWMCDLRFFREGTLVKGFSNGRMAVAGDVVWVITNSQVQRYVDTGTALELTASKSSTVGGSGFLLATETELLTLRGLTIERHTYDGTATLTTQNPGQLPGTSGTIGRTGMTAFLVRSGDRLGVVTNAPGTAEGQSGNIFTNQVCLYELHPDRIVRTPDPCQMFTGDVVGYEPSVIWVGTRFPFGELFQDLRRLEWTATGISEQASLPLGVNFELSTQSFSTRSQVVPVVLSLFSTVSAGTRATVAVYSPERRAILLELLDSEMREPSASGTLQWTGPMAGAVTPRVRVRPTTP